MSAIETEQSADWCIDAGAIAICGTDMEEVSRNSEGVKWCFTCRVRHEFWWVVLAPDGFSYYGPTARMEGIRSGCRDLFPGRYWVLREDGDE